MIQRIQSVYLFLAVIVSVLIFTVSIGVSCDDPDQYITDSGAALIAHIAASVMTIATIFFYRKRKVQMKMCVSSMILFFLSFVMCSFQATVSLCNIGYGCVIPLLSAVLVFLAWNAIKKDEKLVRSADRLR